MRGSTVPLSRRDFLKVAAGLPPLLAGALPAGAQVAPAVDMQLLLAVDASASVDTGLLDFQLRGHADAFRHPAVAEAITNGPHRRIAVSLVQFAGPETLTILIPWRELRDGGDCTDFAASIDAAPGVAMGGSTALGSAVVQAVELMDRAPYRAQKRTIDLVSNGFSNAGIAPRSARGYAAAANVGVNALAILNEYEWLEDYYSDQLIAGPGAFVRAAARLEDFGAAILQKLVTEIA